jgi:hypothetical protein
MINAIMQDATDIQQQLAALALATNRELSWIMKWYSSPTHELLALFYYPYTANFGLARCYSFLHIFCKDSSSYRKVRYLLSHTQL